MKQKVQVIDKKTGHLVAEFDRKSRTGEYFLLPNTNQAKVFESIQFEGFDRLPKGFYRKGYGLTKPAGFLVDALRERLGTRIKLTITVDGEPSVRRYRGRVCHVRLPHSAYWDILSVLRDIASERNKSSAVLVSQKLAAMLPADFAAPDDTVETAFDYSADKLSTMAGRDPELVAHLSKRDIETIAELYAAIIDRDLIGSSKKDIKILAGSKAASERVYLERVVEQFEQNLQKPSMSEASWQRFLRDFILLFNTSYVAVLEKLSVSLGGKYPDFLLIDVLSYVDVYEIKKPTTNLLKLDASRSNYYWDTELAKAISQTENYLDLLGRNALAFRDEVKKSKGLDIKVVRPRGFIIAGKSDQLSETKKGDDFRLLCDGLKNLDVILYDDLLNNLKNLISRL